MMRQRGRKRRIVQLKSKPHSSAFFLSLSLSLSTLPCCVTSKRGGAQGGDEFISWDRVRWRRQREKLLHSIEGRGVKTAERAAGSRWTRGQRQQRSERNHKMEACQEGFKSYNVKGKTERRCSGFHNSFPLHPSNPPPPALSTPPLSPLRQCNLLKPCSTDDVTSLDKVSCCSKSSFPRWFSCTLEDVVYQRG